MRLVFSLCFVLALTGICAAQDTNFSNGPQYLMANGSSIFARSIATPSLSLDATLSAIPSFPAVEPPAINQLVVASFEPASPEPANSELATSESKQQTGLFAIYYGAPAATVVEIVSAEPASVLPEGIVNVGVEQMTDAPSLQVRGFGVTLAEAASLWKTHKVPASRIYTNRDIERLHGG